MPTKPFDMLTNEELCNLTEAQISDYVDYELAERGLPINIILSDPPEVITIDPDEEAYVLDRFDDLIIDKVAADAIMHQLERACLRKSGYGGVISEITPTDYNYPKINLLRFESEKRKAEKAISRALLNEAWKAYNEQKKAFQEAENVREDVLESFSAKISSARNAAARRQQLLVDWARYLKLADNDQAIAKNFFVDRYSVSEFDELFPTISNQEACA